MAGIRLVFVTATAVAILTLAAQAQARDWHVAPDGVDGSAGTVVEPLATLAHAVGRASAGDAILLERCGTFRALDLAVGSSLSIAAYGNGPRPIVTGSVVSCP